jgi:hypothetical protein
LLNAYKFITPYFDEYGYNNGGGKEENAPVIDQAILDFQQTVVRKVSYGSDEFFVPVETQYVGISGKVHKGLVTFSGVDSLLGEPEWHKGMNSFTRSNGNRLTICISEDRWESIRENTKPSKSLRRVKAVVSQ